MKLPTGARWLLAVPILLVDVTAFSNVFRAYEYFEAQLTAALIGLAFACLQVGCLVLYPQSEAATRRWLLAGVTILFVISGVTNVSMAYLRANESLPADDLLPVIGFGGTNEQLLVGASWILGLALPVVGLIMWSAFAESLRKEKEQKAKEDADFRQLFEKKGVV